jgi:hypothetical protein
MEAGSVQNVYYGSGWSQIRITLMRSRIRTRTKLKSDLRIKVKKEGLHTRISFKVMGNRNTAYKDVDVVPYIR